MEVRVRQCCERDVWISQVRHGWEGEERYLQPAVSLVLDWWGWEWGFTLL